MNHPRQAAPPPVARALAGAGLLVTLLGGCTSAEGEGIPDGMREIEIPFDAVIDGRPWSCNETFMLGTPAVPVQPSHLQLFVYDVTAVDENGEASLIRLRDGEWQGNFEDPNHNIALLNWDDATGNCEGTSDPETNKVITGFVPEDREFVGLSFRIGVPTELNHLDAGLAPPPLNRPGMWWSWKDGHMLLRAEFDTPAHDGKRPQTADDTSQPSGWALWLAEAGYGPQECTPSGDSYSCANSFQPRVELGTFAVGDDSVLLDFSALLEGVDMNRTEFDEWPADDEPDVGDPTITGYPMPDYYASFFMDRVDGEGAVILQNLGIDWVTMSMPDPSLQVFARRAP
jgi:uncharacterized repeat protein (TIGR04052 family)